ncbi:MAG: hypothetical protein O3C22_04025 [Bacteroidetes bacterium]|nr:hypothetical protein [Bacteroidota bacterium]MDA0942731.1 hypothetical protein [Bacteroidota bacterium]MDA1111385.1 hypothetical protein [Bacteroidota bacterium]
MKHSLYLFAAAAISLASCGSDAQSGEATDISSDSGNAYSISVDQSVVG